MEQQSIFDEKFLEGVRLTRRRELLPMFVKIYAWLCMATAALLVINTAIEVFSRAEFMMQLSYSIGYLIGILGVLIVFYGIVFMMGFSVWMEYKWAIRYNYVIAVLSVLYIFMSFLALGVGFVKTGLSSILLIPYWLALRKVQYKWENEAVTGKKAKLY